MNKDSKYQMHQIKYVNDLLFFYGIRGLSDYNTLLSQNVIDDRILADINRSMDEFKTYFPTKGFNLKRKNYQIDSQSLALSFLKNCLSHIGMNYEIVRTSQKTSLRLKPINKILLKFIETNKMSDIAHTTQSDLVHSTQLLSKENKSSLSDVKYTYQLIALEEDKEARMTSTKLSLDLIQCIVKKIKLISLPSNYIYSFYINGSMILESELVDGVQTFDFAREDSEFLNIFRKVISLPKDFTDKEPLIKALNFARIDCPWIDVKVLDPYDSFHIYNPITNQFKDNQYEIEIEGFSTGELKPFTETVKIYPNHTFSLPVNLLVERIQILENYDTIMTTEYGDLFPNEEGIYSFTNKQEFDSGKRNFFCNNKYGDLQKENSESTINQEISKYFPDKKCFLNNETLNFSRLNKAKLILKNKNNNIIPKIPFRVKYYNLKVTKEYSNGVKEEYLMFR